MIGQHGYMRGQLYRGSFAPGPYGNTRVLVPAPMDVLPAVYLRAHAWPGSDRAAMERAARNYAAEAIRARYFLPRQTPTRATTALNAVKAVDDASRFMARMQMQAVAKVAAGLPLNAQEAQIALRIAMPQGVDFNALKRAGARREYGASYPARQVPFSPPPKAAYQALERAAHLRAAFFNPQTARAAILRQHVMRETTARR